jgi:hypothetical protein
LASDIALLPRRRAVTILLAVLQGLAISRQFLVQNGELLVGLRDLGIDLYFEFINISFQAMFYAEKIGVPDLCELQVSSNDDPKLDLLGSQLPHSSASCPRWLSQMCLPSQVLC